MTEVNNFNLKAFDIGGTDGAVANDGKLTGEEVDNARKAGWTVWDEFREGDKAEYIAEEDKNTQFIITLKNMLASETYKKFCKLRNELLKEKLANMGILPTKIMGQETYNIDTILFDENYKKAMAEAEKEAKEQLGLSQDAYTFNIKIGDIIKKDTTKEMQQAQEQASAEDTTILGIKKQAKANSFVAINNFSTKSFTDLGFENSKVPNWFLAINAETVAQSLIDEIYSGRANLDNIMPNINGDNVIDVLQKYKELSDEKNTKFGQVIDNETLIEAILDETISKEKKKEYINHIKDALIERMNKISGRAEEFSKIFEKAIDKALSYPTGLQSSEFLDKLITNFIDTLNQVEKLHKASYTPDYTSDTYFEKVKEIYSEYGYNVSDLLGNGKFDNPAIQLAGNCWVHAGINAMIQTEVGRAYLENTIVKNKYTGAISVYLAGAEKQGLPKPKGDGIYTYTEKQLCDRFLDTAIGDGDYTALMLAVEDFRKEAENNPNATSAGGSVLEFCNIVLGDEDSFDIIISKKDLKKAIEDGIPLYIAVKNPTILGEGYNNNGGKHAVAIKSIDTKRNVAILIDSNSPDKPIEVDLDVLLDFDNCAICNLKIPNKT